MDIPTLAAARKYTNQSILGLTIIKAASVEVKSITPITTATGQTGNKVTFEWTGNDGTTKLTDDIEVMNGVSITDVTLDQTTDHIKVTLSDGTIKDCGKAIYEPYARNTTSVEHDDPAKVTSTVMPDKKIAFDFEIPKGYSPEVTVERNTDDDGVTITVTEEDGTTQTVDVYDGKDGEGKTIQFKTLPTPEADLLGEIYQYTGDTDDALGLHHGYFYECKDDGNGGYEWQQLNTQEADEGLTTEQMNSLLALLD